MISWIGSTISLGGNILINLVKYILNIKRLKVKNFGIFVGSDGNGWLGVFQIENKTSIPLKFKRVMVDVKYQSKTIYFEFLTKYLEDLEPLGQREILLPLVHVVAPNQAHLANPDRRAIYPCEIKSFFDSVGLSNPDIEKIKVELKLIMSIGTFSSSMSKKNSIVFKDIMSKVYKGEKEAATWIFLGHGNFQSNIFPLCINMS